MKLEVEKEIIEPIVRDHIAAAIIAQIGDPEELIRKMVGLALSKKVDCDGNVSQYSSDNTYDFLEAIAGKAIREAAREAITQMVNEQKPMIREAITKELKRRPQKTAAGIVQAFVNATSSSWRIYTEFKFLKDGE